MPEHCPRYHFGRMTWDPCVKAGWPHMFQVQYAWAYMMGNVAAVTYVRSAYNGVSNLWDAHDTSMLASRI
jgi:hypothetical protein